MKRVYFPACHRMKAAAWAVVTAIALLLPAAAIHVPTASAQDHPRAYTREVTPAGRPFYHRHDPITPYAAINAFWHADDGLEGREGVRQLIGSMIFESARSDGSGDFQERLRDIHASGSISADHRGAGVSAIAPARELAEALDLVLDAMRNANASEKAVRRLRSNAISGEAQSSLQAAVAASRAASTYVLGDHREVRSFAADRFASVEAADVARWRGAVDRKSGPLIAVSGRLTAGEAAAMIDKAFNGWPTDVGLPRKPDRSAAPRPGSVAVAAAGRQAAIQMFAPTRSIVGREATIASIAVQALGGDSEARLFQAVRVSLGAAYGASAALGTIDDDQRSITLSASVDPDRLEASVAAIRNAYERWYQAGVSEQEVRNRAEKAATAYANAFKNPGTANGVVLALLRQGRQPQDIETHEAFLRSLTAAQVNAFITERLPPIDAFVLSVATPADTTFPAKCTVKDWKDVARSCPR